MNKEKGIIKLMSPTWLLAVSCLIGGTVAAQADAESKPQAAAKLVAKARANQDLRARIALLNKAVNLDPTNAQAYFWRGQAKRQIGRVGPAIEDLTESIRLQPRVCQFFSERAQCYLIVRRLDKAVDDATAAIKINERDAFSYLVRAQALIRKGLYDRASKDLDRALRFAGAHARWYAPKVAAERANLLNQQKRFKAALKSCNSSLESAGQDTGTKVYALRLKSSILLGLKSHGKALAAARKAVKIAPTDPGTHNILGHCLMINRDFSAAVEAFTKGIELRPGMAHAYRDRGNAYLKLGKLRNALADADRALKADPNFAGAHGLRGAVYEHMGRYAEGLASYNEQIKRQPRNCWVLTRRSGIYSSLNKLDLAARDAQAAIRIEPLYAPAHIAKGNLGLKRYWLKRFGTTTKGPEQLVSDYEWGLAPTPNARPGPSEAPATQEANSPALQAILVEAIKDFRRAADLDPGQPGPHTGTAQALAWQGKIQEAIKAASKAVEIAPGLSYAYVGRADIYRQAKKWDEAIADCTKALKLVNRRTDRVSLLGTRAACLYAKHQLTGALNDTTMALKLRPDYSFGRHVRIDCLLKLSRYKDAEAEANVLLKLNNKDYWAHAKRAWALFYSCQWQAALEQWNKAIGLASNKTQPYLERARCHLRMGNCEKAIADASKAIKEGNPPAAYVIRAACYAKLNRRSQALADLHKASALAASSGQHMPRRFLAVVHVMLGDEKAALSELRKVAKKSGSDPFAMLGSYIFATRTGGNVAEVKKQLAGFAERKGTAPWTKQVIRLYLGKASEKAVYASLPKNPPFLRKQVQCETYYYLGAWRHMTGDVKSAIDLYKKCVQTGVAYYFQHMLASADLQRLKKK